MANCKCNISLKNKGVKISFFVLKKYLIECWHDYNLESWGGQEVSEKKLYLDIEFCMYFVFNISFLIIIF